MSWIQQGCSVEAAPLSSALPPSTPTTCQVGETTGGEELGPGGGAGGIRREELG